MTCGKIVAMLGVAGGLMLGLGASAIPAAAQPYYYPACAPGYYYANGYCYPYTPPPPPVTYYYPPEYYGPPPVAIGPSFGITFGFGGHERHEFFEHREHEEHERGRR